MATSGLAPQVGELNDPQLRTMAELVRLFLRDFPELNRLTAGEDHSPRMIYWAIIDTLSDWASTPPFVGQNLGTIIDRGWQSIFIRGCAISLLESLMILHARNQLSYSDGGVNVQTEDPRTLQAILSMLRATYEQKKLQVLVALNIEQGMEQPGVHSEYVHLFWLGGGL